MKNFQRLNNIVGWSVFAIALFAYVSTVEPTASFWDCSEFIACSYKLEVPHPPGAPFFLLVGRIASMFAGGDVYKVALMVNMVSVLSSAFTILFLFWTISLLARKVFNKRAEELDLSQTILVLGASAVGALTYTFSESFWFSAVEGEVYGMSSFFTAIVVWAAFRWELIEEEAAANRWLIFVAYLVGLSIGVHLLNLVTIPALSLLYYYKRYKKITWWGGIASFMVGMVILGIVNVGVISGLPSIAFELEKIFVNTFGLPFKSGVFFFIAVFIGAVVWGIIYTQKHNKIMANTALLAFAFILIGYSSYTLALVRSNFDPPLNENNPKNVLNYVYYLKREQYGSRSLTYGPIYTARLQDIKRGEPMYKIGKDKYEVYDYKPDYVWEPGSEMLFPRIWSSDASHVARYKQMLNLADGQKPTFGDNLKFMFTHQFGTMYWRYFAWNFWGKASDLEGGGAVNVFEGKDKLPSSLAQNRGRTNFFGIPILLGILGLLYLYFKREREFLVVLLLFLFTGLALSVFLNSPPTEPRERFYIFVGSFYFWTVWVGIGVMALADWGLKFIKNPVPKAAVATGLCLVVPLMMAPQTWKGNDRSGRYHQVDFAKNLLNSCAKDAILFTGGDNDTFPLWYVQEVEGFRTDVRVCNLSLLGTDWYIDQMKRRTYESSPLPITFKTDQYLGGVNDQIPFVKNSNPQILAGINLKEYLELVKQNSPAIQVQYSNGDNINTLPSSNFFMPVDVEAVKKMGFVPKEYEDKINPTFAWTLGERDILKNDLIMLDIIAHNDWKRPIYFSGTLSNENYLNLKDNMALEGYAFRLMPYKLDASKEGFVNTDVMYNNMMHKMFWRNMDNSNVYYDSETYLKVPIITARYAFLRLADQLIREGKKDKAREVLDHADKVMPDKAIPYDQLSANFVLFYLDIGDSKKGLGIADTIAKRCDENLNYFVEKSKEGNNAEWGPSIIQQEIQYSMSNIQMLANVCKQYGQPEASKKYQAIYDKYYNKIQ